MEKLGIFYSCFKETNAVNFSIDILNIVYPNIKIYLVSDGGEDFSYLTKKYPNVKAVLESDTMSKTFELTDESFREEEKQKIIKNCAQSVINRLKDASDYLETEYILMCDPDTLVRGKLNIPDGVELLGSKINSGTSPSYKKVLSSIDGAISIDSWGATPAIFKTSTFLKSLEVLKTHPKLFNNLSESFHALYAHDFLLPTLFALVGKEETYNPDIVECNRNKMWSFTNQPLVHQFKYLY
jgi:hypothetical protein